MKNENIELASVGKASSVLVSSPFGPLGGGGFNSAPNSPIREGIVKEKADAKSASFRNRLVRLLSIVEKEATDYNSLKEMIKDGSHHRRTSVTAQERRVSRAAAGLPPRRGDLEENLMPKTLSVKDGKVEDCQRT